MMVLEVLYTSFLSMKHGDTRHVSLRGVTLFNMALILFLLTEFCQQLEQIILYGS